MTLSRWNKSKVHGLDCGARGPSYKCDCGLDDELIAEVARLQSQLSTARLAERARCARIANKIGSDLGESAIGHAIARAIEAEDD